MKCMSLWCKHDLLLSFFNSWIFFFSCLSYISGSLSPHTLKRLFMFLSSIYVVSGVLTNDLKKIVYKTFRNRQPTLLKHSLLEERAEGLLCVQKYLREGKDFFSSGLPLLKIQVSESFFCFSSAYSEVKLSHYYWNFLSLFTIWLSKDRYFSNINSDVKLIYLR